MKNEELPKRVEEKRSSGQIWEEVCELPEAAGGYIWRRVTSRRREFGRPAGATGSVAAKSPGSVTGPQRSPPPDSDILSEDQTAGVAGGVVCVVHYRIILRREGLNLDSLLEGV